MEVEIEDVVFFFSVIFILALFLFINNILDYVLQSLVLLWIGLSSLILSHTYIYIRKKRDLKIEKLRFLISIVPTYIILIYLSRSQFFELNVPKNENIVLVVLIVLLLILSAIAENYVKRKKN